MNRLSNIVRPSILQLEPYSSARDEFKGSEGIFLDANENPYGTLNRYPDPYQKELKEKLSTLKSINTENIFIGNGSDEVIDLAFRIFCRPGTDKALTFSPTYGMYDVSAAINEVELVKLPLDDSFQIDTSQLDNYFDNDTLKLIFICSPNNPTGKVINNDDITYILERFEGMVIVDEAYIDFAETASCVELTDQYDNLIVSQTFSKAWGLAAARVGAAYANKETIQLFNKVKPPYNVSQLNQQAALAAIKNVGSFRSTILTIKEERQRVKRELEQLTVVKKVYPSEANFLLIEVDEANELYDKLVCKKIIIRNRNKQIKNCLRITIGTPEENNLLLKTLKNPSL